MSYAVAQDLVDRFGEEELIQLTNRPGETFDAVNTARAERALDDASEEIDGYLRPRYAVPVTQASRQLTSLCCDIARERLQLAGGHMPTDTVTTAAKRARAFLQHVAEGKAQLDLPGSASQGDAPATGRVEGPPRIFSRETLEGF